tara:strand:- start:2356 stop:2892 length:537 start_codon:yes stop_codon:yes gene_type:complete
MTALLVGAACQMGIVSTTLVNPIVWPQAASGRVMIYAKMDCVTVAVVVMGKTNVPTTSPKPHVMRSLDHRTGLVKQRVHRFHARPGVAATLMVAMKHTKIGAKTSSLELGHLLAMTATPLLAKRLLLLARAAPLQVTEGVSRLLSIVATHPPTSGLRGERAMVILWRAAMAIGVKNVQ